MLGRPIISIVYDKISVLLHYQIKDAIWRCEILATHHALISIEERSVQLAIIVHIKINIELEMGSAMFSKDISSTNLDMLYCIFRILIILWS